VHFPLSPIVPAAQIELSPEETELVVNTLVYDGRLEEVRAMCLFW
jgi:hypothetical protein